MLISWATVPVCTASQTRRGGPDEAWRAECDTVLPHFLRELTKMAKAYQICTDMDEVFRLEHKGWVCEASPRRSYGYLYLDIYHPAH
ncbi:MAG: type IV toxin-antitoxin system YeeU family antitoxin [Aeromonas veronii]